VRPGSLFKLSMPDITVLTISCFERTVIPLHWENIDL
jgi:hypothetical protein